MTKNGCQWWMDRSWNASRKSLSSLHNFHNLYPSNLRTAIHNYWTLHRLFIFLDFKKRFSIVIWSQESWLQIAKNTVRSFGNKRTGIDYQEVEPLGTHWQGASGSLGCDTSQSRARMGAQYALLTAPAMLPSGGLLILPTAGKTSISHLTRKKTVPLLTCVKWFGSCAFAWPNWCGGWGSAF